MSDMSNHKPSDPSPTAKKSTDAILTLDTAKGLLGQLTVALGVAGDDLGELSRIEVAAAALGDLTKRARFGLVAQNEVAAVRFRCHLRIGQILAEHLPRGRPKEILPGEEVFPTLAELGYSYNFSTYCQSLAHAGSEAVEAWIAHGLVVDEMTGPDEPGPQYMRPVELTKRGLTDYLSGIAYRRAQEHRRATVAEHQRRSESVAAAETSAKKDAAKWGWRHVDNGNVTEGNAATEIAAYQALYEHLTKDLDDDLEREMPDAIDGLRGYIESFCESDPDEEWEITDPHGATVTNSARIGDDSPVDDSLDGEPIPDPPPLPEPPIEAVKPPGKPGERMMGLLRIALGGGNEHEALAALNAAKKLDPRLTTIVEVENRDETEARESRIRSWNFIDQLQKNNNTYWGQILALNETVEKQKTEIARLKRTVRELRAKNARRVQPSAVT